MTCLLVSHGIAAEAATLIAGTSQGPYRSTDSGATWKEIFMNFSDPALQKLGFPKLNSLAVDPKNPANVFAGVTFTGVTAFLRSSDSGQTWSVISMPSFGFDAGADGLAIDPVMTNVIYAATPQQGLEISIDGGVTWTTPAMPNPLPGLKVPKPYDASISGVAVDPNHTGVVYVVGPDGSSTKSNGYVLASADYGQTWTILAQSLNFSGRIFVDPGNSQVLYGTNVGSSVGLTCDATNGGKCGLYQSTDGGKTWLPTSFPSALVQSVAFDTNANVLYVWADKGASDVTSGAPGGLFKSPDGGVTWTQVLQNVGVATFGKVARVDPANAGTVYSLGPTGADTVSRSTDSGATWTMVKLPPGCYHQGDLICPIDITIQDLALLPPAPPAPAGPSISANGVVNGASYRPGVVPNSWVTILGTNLAPGTDDWTHAIVNGALPTSLDGVSVTIGGKPAVVYFISAGQLNVLAPDLPPGPATVTVTTPAGVSAPVSVTVAGYDPAIFAWPGNQAVATRQDYSFAVKPGTFAQVTTAAAKPGEVLVLWGTGFGPTDPSAPTGVAVPSDRVYNTTTPPTVTIGNVPATVVGAALSPGSVGLYQIAIEVPDGLADGDWPVQASIGGVASPAGITLTVHR